jgi:hypothetical protein
VLQQDSKHNEGSEAAFVEPRNGEQRPEFPCGSLPSSCSRVWALHRSTDRRNVDDNKGYCQLEQRLDAPATAVEVTENSLVEHDK